MSAWIHMGTVLTTNGSIILFLLKTGDVMNIKRFQLSVIVMIDVVSYIDIQNMKSIPSTVAKTPKGAG